MIFVHRIANDLFDGTAPWILTSFDDFSFCKFFSAFQMSCVCVFWVLFWTGCNILLIVSINEK